MPVKSEKVEITDISITEMLNPEFSKALKKGFEDLEPVTIVFVNKKTSMPLLVSHENQNEIDQKIAHIQCKDDALLNKFVKMLEKRD